MMDSGHLRKVSHKTPELLSESTDFNPYSEWIIGALNMDSQNNGPRKSEQVTPQQRVEEKVGFVNMGLTCYVNATLQALFQLKSFTNWLKQDREHQDDCIDKQNCSFCAMKRLWEKICRKEASVIAPTEIVSRLQSIGSDFQIGVQDDAHDFLIKLLDSIEVSLRNAHGSQPKDNVYSEKKSVYSQLFGQIIESIVCCEKCGRESKHDDFLSELELDMKDVTSIEDAVKNYFKKETLADYKCETCKSEGDSSKQFRLSTPPKILCLYLKRFTQDGLKITKPVHCNKHLDLSEYLSPKSNKVTLKYRLSSRILHKGSSPNSGHYTTIARDCEGKYTLYNDEIVQQLGNNEKPCSDTYIVFYEMQESCYDDPRKSIGPMNFQSLPQSTTCKTAWNGSCEPILDIVVSSCCQTRKSNALSLGGRTLKPSETLACDSSVSQNKHVTQIGGELNDETITRTSKNTKRKLNQEKCGNKKKITSEDGSSNIKVPKLDGIKDITDATPSIKMDGIKTYSRDSSEMDDQRTEQLYSPIQQQTGHSKEKTGAFKKGRVRPSCDICYQTFKDMHNLKCHKSNIHKIKGLFTCDICGKAFDGSKEKKLHFKSAHESKPAQCDVCDKTFESPFKMLKHKRSVHKNKGVYQCALCEKVFDTKLKEQKHFKRIHGQKPFECGICRKKFQLLCDLNRHLTTHTKVAKVKPVNPGKQQPVYDANDQSGIIGPNTGNQNGRLKDSTKIKVPKLGEKSDETNDQRSGTTQKLKGSNQECIEKSTKEKVRVSCNICPQTFRDRHTLKRHKSTIHKIKGLYTCDICGEAFDSIEEKKVHVKSTHKPKSFECDMCNKVFKSIKYLNSHKHKAHAVKGLYKCPICEKAFDTSSGKAKHILLTHGPKPFECEQCGKKFPALYKLNRHLSSHEREAAKRKFLNHTVQEQAPTLPDSSLSSKKIDADLPKSFLSCNICGNQFFVQTSLDFHRKTIHSINKMYKCFFCTSEFVSISERNKHRKNVHGNKPFNCSECNKKFRKIQLLNQHLQNSHGIRATFNCMQCPSTFDSKQELNFHVAVDHKKQEIVSCRHCSMNVLRSSLYNHVRKVHPNVKLVFKKTLRKLPGRYKRTRRELNEQFILKHGHKRYKCNECEKSFHERCDLLRHKSMHHMAKHVYFCDICKRNFRLYIDFKKHRERAHNLGEYKCNVCQEVFGTTQILHKHMIDAHASRRIFKCPECDALMWGRPQVQRHLDFVHNPKNPYHCKLCKNMYKTAPALRMHLNLAHGIQGYICEECPVEFQRLSHLMEHKEEKHPDLNLHKCENCGIGFNTKEQLRFHKFRRVCLHYDYKFDSSEEKSRHFKMQYFKHNRLNMMALRNSKLIRNLKNKTLAEQKDDFVEIYELSKRMVPLNDSLRKLYGLVFVPNYVTEDHLKTYLQDPSTEKYFNIGKLSPGSSCKTISEHHTKLQDCAATMMRINSGFKCFHIFDMWISEHFEDHSQETLNYFEALNILKLLMFAIYYKRDDIFIQKPELDPLYKLDRHVVQELLDDVIRSKGDIFCLSGFGYQFSKEIKIKDPHELATRKESGSCIECKAVHNLYTPYLKIRHAVKCSKRKYHEKREGRTQQLLSLKAVKVNSIVKILKQPCLKRRYICYSITGIKKILRTRNDVIEYSGNTMNYHGQNSYGHVSSYHAHEKCKSSVRNMAKMGYQLYLIYIWRHNREISMYQTEIMLQIREVVRTSKGSKSKPAFRSLKMYNVSLLFTFNEWMEVFSWSRDEGPYTDSLPKFVQASRKSTFENITKAILNGNSNAKFTENESRDEEEDS